MEDEKKNEMDNSTKKNANKIVVFMLVFLIFISLLSFFFNMQSAISDLFDPRYQSLMQAIFSLIVLSVGVLLLKMFYPK